MLCLAQRPPALEGEILHQEPLAPYTSLRIGGPARYLIKPASVEDVQRALAFAQERGMPWRVLGNGTNTLFDDAGYRGVVLHLGPGTRLNRMALQGDRLWVQGGASLAAARHLCELHGHRALDFLIGIPGTVGGALAMNAGIPEAAIGSVVESVTVMDVWGKVRQWTAAECAFAYRSSAIRRDGLIVLGAQLRLDSAIAWDKVKLLERRKRQPVGRSPGCVFKNPAGAPGSAGWLIDRSGLKGYTVGDAQVSRCHANFILNQGQARSADVLSLIDIVREKVYKEFSLELHLELEVVLN